MEFNPNNPIVKYCIQGMAMEEKGQPEEAAQVFLQAWHEATNDFEKYLAANYVARHQKSVPDQLKWLETTLQFALNVNNDAVRGLFRGCMRKSPAVMKQSATPIMQKNTMNWRPHPGASRRTKGPFITGRGRTCRSAIS